MVREHLIDAYLNRCTLYDYRRPPSVGGLPCHTHIDRDGIVRTYDGTFCLSRANVERQPCRLKDALNWP